MGLDRIYFIIVLVIVNHCPNSLLYIEHSIRVIGNQVFFVILGYDNVDKGTYINKNRTTIV